MKNTNFRYKLYVITTLVLALLLAVIRTVLLLYYFDRDVNYYTRGTDLPAIHTILLFIAAVFAASSLFAASKDEPKEKNFHLSGFFIFSSSICAFMLTAQFILSLTKNDLTTLEKTAYFTALPAAIYFLSVLLNSGNWAKLRTIFGFFVPIWGTLNLAAVYFDSYVAINNPNKVIEQMAFISVMLFFLYELRIHLAKPQPKLHLFFGLCALVFTATASFPGIIAVSFGTIDGKYLIYDVIFAAMFLYICRTMLASFKEE